MDNMIERGPFVPNEESIRYEVMGRFRDIEDQVGKVHLSVRWESMARIARVGACIEHYAWDSRMAVVDRLSEFQLAHLDDFALEFDVVPLHAVQDEEFAQA